MELEFPDGPATAAYLDDLPHVEAALPVLVSDDDEVLAFVVVEETEAELFAYAPFGGWRSVESADAGQYQEVKELWELVLRATFTDPIPDSLDAHTEIEEARQVHEELLERSAETGASTG